MILAGLGMKPVTEEAERRPGRPAVVLLPLQKRRFGIPARMFAGLSWLTPRQGPEGRASLSDTARRSEFEAEIGTVRDITFIQQYGLGWKDLNTPLKRPFEPWEAGAAAMASAVGEARWVGLWPLDPPESERVRWWFVAVNNSEILPDGDMVYGSMEEGIDRLTQELSYFGPDTFVYAPPSLGIQGSMAASWQDLIHRVPGPLLREFHTTATAVTRLAPFAAIAAGVIVSVGLVVSYSGDAFHAIQSWLFPAPAPVPVKIVEKVQEQIHDAGEIITKAVTPPPPQYQDPVIWVNRCIFALDEITAYVGGWGPTGLSCSGNNVAVTYSVEQANAPKEWLSQAVPLPATFADERRATVSTSFDPPVSTDSKTRWTASEATDWLGRVHSQTGLVVTIDASPKCAAPTFSKAIGFTLTAPLSPLELRRLLGDAAQLEICSMHATMNNGVLGAWSIEGVIHVSS